MRIYNSFRRLLAAESAQVSPVPLVQGEESSVRERYAPMSRLLAEADISFLERGGLAGAAKKLRREHRQCYFGYVDRLAGELRAARTLGTLAMASRERWSFRILLARTLLGESSLLYLRWLGYRHALGIRVTALDVSDCLDALFAVPKFQPTAT